MKMINYIQRSATLHFIFACLITWLTGYWLVLADMKENQLQLAKRYSELRQTFEQKQFQSVNIEAYSQQVQEVKSELSKLNQKLPANISMSDIIDNIEQWIEPRNIPVAELKFSKSRDSEFYREYNLTIDLFLSFADFVDLINYLKGPDRNIIHIRHFSIEKISGDPRLRGRLYLSYFSYKDKDES